MTEGVGEEDWADRSTTEPFDEYMLAGRVGHGTTIHRILVLREPDKDQASMVQKPSSMLLGAVLLLDWHILCGLCLR